MIIVNGNPTSEIRKIKRIAKMPESVFNSIYDYLNQEVTTQMQGGDWFSLRDIGGGSRWDWTGTPLRPLYDHYAAQPGISDKKAQKKAGQSCGRILQAVIIDRPEAFEQKSIKKIANYRLVKDGQ